ncbi:MAG: ATP-binding protein [Weeksellaceae bacterium]|nr:ATP-binding protein [Weeksellaceae bacterium]
MVLKSAIKESVFEQKENLHLAQPGLQRESNENLQLSPDFITIITGVRRCGKSTLLLQLLKNLSKDDYAYFNFEDPRIFGFDVNDFPKLEKVLGNKSYYFFDEIQNVDKWELFIRKLHDNGKIICLTGSNASLLSKELGTRLTGRNLQYELFPFSYQEFCDLKNKERSVVSFDDYLDIGGFPLYIKTGNQEYLHQLFRDILFRDIIVRYGIRNSKIMEGIALFLISNVAKEYSLTNIKNTFGVGSTNSISDYVSWLEDSYLIFTLPRFSWSLKSVAVNPKKIYTIDSGFAQANSLSFSSDKGRLFENAVFIHLRKRKDELFYFKEKGECDFVIKRKNKVIEVVQACYDLNDDNFHQEISGLKEAMDFFNLKKGTLVTRNQTDEWKENEKQINIVSAEEWF